MQKNDTSLISRLDIPAALALLSRLPIKVAAGGFERGAYAAWAYPLVGLILGGLAGVSGALAIWIGLPPMIAAMIAIAILIVISGAMHEDGLADAVDGLWGGWNREARLKIMKDSHIGTYGVIALGLSLALRSVALAAVFEAGMIILPMIAVAVISRAAMVVVMAALPGARDSGLGHSVGRPSFQTAGLAVAISVVVAIICLGWIGIVGVALAGLTAICVALIARNKIGGQTGDILGATQQCAEIVVLLWLITY